MDSLQTVFVQNNKTALPAASSAARLPASPEALIVAQLTAGIARENDIAPAQISEWKKQLEERLGEVFRSKGERSRELQARERKEARLERKIGQLVVEKDFLVKKCKQLGIDPNERP